MEGVRGELAVNLSTLSLISLGGGSPRSLGFHLPTFSSSSFRWSPDGQRIAYVVWNDLWVMDVETGKSDNVTNTPNRVELDPRWSPDGKWIAFLSSRGLEPGEATETVIKVPVDRLYVIDLMTGRFQEVSVQPIRAFSWSPDSRRMAYGDEQGHLFTFDLLHGKHQPLVLTDYGLSSDLSACSATWSPQGDTIAIFFSSRPAPEEKSAWKGYALLDLVNHTARILHDYTMTETMAYGGFPSGEHVGGCDQGPALWSPSGEWLLLTILPAPRTNLDGSFWLADSQGKQKRRLGSTYGAYAADWSPDGKWIAYIDLGDRSLRLASLTNSDREYVVMGERCCEGLAWRPDGSNR